MDRPRGYGRRPHQQPYGYSGRRDLETQAYFAPEVAPPANHYWREHQQEQGPPQRAARSRGPPRHAARSHGPRHAARSHGDRRSYRNAHRRHRTSYRDTGARSQYSRHSYRPISLSAEDDSLLRKLYKNLEHYGAASVPELCKDLRIEDASTLTKLLVHGRRTGHLRTIHRKHKADLFALQDTVSSSSWQQDSNNGGQLKRRRVELAPAAPRSMTRMQIAQQHLDAARSSGAQLITSAISARLLRECFERGIAGPTFADATKHVSNTGSVHWERKCHLVLENTGQSTHFFLGEGTSLDMATGEAARSALKFLEGTVLSVLPAESEPKKIHDTSEFAPSSVAPSPNVNTPFRRLHENEDERQKDREMLQQTMLFRVSNRAVRQPHQMAPLTKGVSPNISS